MPDGKTATTEKTFPKDPYKGLTYYGPEHAPLFAGRDLDVRRVARVLSTGSTRVVLLHGATGCGKSSFLRAGLIPFLEEEVGAFRFAKDTGSDQSAIFVRSTDSPLERLASEVARYAVQQFGPAASDDPNSRSPHIQQLYVNRDNPRQMKPFLSDVRNEPELLVTLLSELSRAQPRTTVLVLDQAEEMLTLCPSHDCDALRAEFFEFLGFFTSVDIDVKLIITFRTEYHGKFYTLLRQGGADVNAVDDYFLDELTKSDLVEAIRRPTSEEKIRGYGVPLKHYKFILKGGLPEQIATDLMSTPLSGGVLPVLQIVCRQLYEQAKEHKGDGIRTIRVKDYKKVGRVEGQIDRHLQQALEACFKDSVSYFQVKNETMRWRDILSVLALPQPGDFVTTDVKEKDELEIIAKRKRARARLEPTMEFLALDKWKIVRPVRRTKRSSDEEIDCFSLGHDVLGLVLKTWHDRREKDKDALRIGIFLCAGISALVTIFVQRNAFFPAWASYAGWAVTLALGLLGSIPDHRWTQKIYSRIYGYLLDVVGKQRLP